MESNTTRAALRARSRARLRAAAVAVVALGATMLTAAPAMAGLQHEFAAFNDCPVNTPGVVGCVVSYTTSGEFHIGSKAVPINKTITLQGGLSESSPDLVPAADGNTLSKTPLQLPGGLLGIELIPGLTEVQAVAELAGPVVLNLKNFFAQKGTTVSLPLSVNLVNPLLGSSCHIGTSSSPVAPQLTSGTTSPPSPGKPITGQAGAVEFTGGGNIVTVKNSLVDNAFSVPGASGCGGLLSFLIDPAVDLVAGVPAAAGHNTAILNGTFENVSSTLVKDQREIPAFGRCVKLEGVKQGKEKIYSGSYADAGCLNPAKGGAYEWTPGPGANPSFTAAAGASTLETVGGAALKCSHAVTAGKYTGVKTATATTTFTGCKLVSSKETCQSAGAAAGEIVTGPLEGSLGFITDTAQAEAVLNVSIGLRLTHAASLLTAECASGAKITLSGSVIAPLGTIDKMAASATLAFNATAGKQAPEAFEEEPNSTLQATIGSGSPTQAGLTSKANIKNSELMEIKGEVR
jgi:hypothetical protein